jgi:acetyltransferase-like isoleucine patch superfamily enzyme
MRGMSSAEASGIDVERSEIAPDLRLGTDVRIRARELQIGAGVSIEAGVVIEAERVVLAAGSHIAHGVRIAADTFELGLRSRIESECRLAAVGGAAQHIRFGDHCMFGASNIALVPELLVGDYVKIHNHTLINGLRPCYIGHNTWVGQNCVLNANDVLFIGNNVGIGTYTSIWTHAFFGELLEGSQVFSVAPTIIEDSAWLVGAYNVVSPGLRIGKQAMVLTSSVVAKSIAPGHTVAGVPARDVTDRIPAVRQVPAAERLEMMRRFVREFVEQVHPGRHSELADGHRVQPAHGPAFDVIVRERLRDQDVTSGTLTLAYALADERSTASPNVSYFDLITKAYDKRSSEPEIQIISFMTTYRARFVPRGLERVGVMPVLPAETTG